MTFDWPTAGIVEVTAYVSATGNQRPGRPPVLLPHGSGSSSRTWTNSPQN